MDFHLRSSFRSVPRRRACAVFIVIVGLASTSPVGAQVLAIATARLRRRLEAEVRDDAEFERLLERVVERRLDPASAATELLERGEELAEPR